MKKGQEEMVGFGLIVIIVAVILVIFLWFYLVSPRASVTEDFGVKSLVESASQVTTPCTDNREGTLNVQDLVSWCYEGRACNEGDSCTILNETLDALLGAALSVTNETLLQGYTFSAQVENTSVYKRDVGERGFGTRGHTKEFPKNRRWVRITLDTFY